MIVYIYVCLSAIVRADHSETKRLVWCGSGQGVEVIYMFVHCLICRSLQLIIRSVNQKNKITKECCYNVCNTLGSA